VPAKKTHMQGGTFPWFTQDIPVPLCSPYAIGTEWGFSSEPTCKTCLRMMERQIAEAALRMTLDPIAAALLQAREDWTRLEMSLQRDVRVVVNAIHAGNVPEEDMPSVLQTFGGLVLERANIERVIAMLEERQGETEMAS
jgi:hypothetical protein